MFRYVFSLEIWSRLPNVLMRLLYTTVQPTDHQKFFKYSGGSRISRGGGGGRRAIAEAPTSNTGAFWQKTYEKTKEMDPAGVGAHAGIAPLLGSANEI